MRARRASYAVVRPSATAPNLFRECNCRLAVCLYSATQTLRSAWVQRARGRSSCRMHREKFQSRSCECCAALCVAQRPPQSRAEGSLRICNRSGLAWLARRVRGARCAWLRPRHRGACASTPHAALTARTSVAERSCGRSPRAQGSGDCGLPPAGEGDFTRDLREARVWI